MKFILTLVLSALSLFALEMKNPVQDHIYKVGESVLDFTLKTQHNQISKLTHETSYIFITYDKISTRTQNIFVSSHPSFLKETHTLLIVDVSVVPSGIFSFFVHPRMKRNRHPLIYSFDKNLSKTFPYKENHITIMRLKNKIVKEIVFVNSEKKLKEMFNASI